MSDSLARFRILLVGRGNAGKTTILQKLCSETDMPIVRNRAGKVVSVVNLDPTSSRGVHDIEYEITYPSSPRFVFHDSCGLESGSDAEMQKIADFISRRRDLGTEQGLHTIWICIPLDDNRPASRLFELTTGDVAVVFVFTKYDAIEKLSFNALRNQGRSIREAGSNAPEHAECAFRAQWLPFLKAPNPPPPPPAYVRLKDLNKPEGQCDELTQCTVEVLAHNKPLQQRFVMAMEYRLEMRIQHAMPQAVEHLLKAVIYKGDKIRKELVKHVLLWMPHVHEPD
ncbi:hypothetical protein FRB97_003651, partial [Tulasnella sp. 331]